MLRVYDSGIASAQANMDLDAELLQNLRTDSSPILHLYEWEGPSATYGYFVRPSDHIDLEKAKMKGIQLAKRPTGGGIVFHIWDWAFSFLMPSGHPAFSENTLENYRFVNEAVMAAVEELFNVPESEIIKENWAFGNENFCMAKPTRYDVVYKGRKIAGAAQRKKSQGYLHQGTISLAAPHFELMRSLLHSNSVVDAMTHFTFAPLGFCWDGDTLKKARDAIQKKLTEKLRETL